MNRLKTVVKEHALNEDAMLTRIRSKQHAIHKEEKFMSIKTTLTHRPSSRPRHRCHRQLVFLRTGCHSASHHGNRS